MKVTKSCIVIDKAHYSIHPLIKAVPVCTDLVSVLLWSYEWRCYLPWKGDNCTMQYLCMLVSVFYA